MSESSIKVKSSDSEAKRFKTITGSPADCPPCHRGQLNLRNIMWPGGRKPKTSVLSKAKNHLYTCKINKKKRQSLDLVADREACACLPADLDLYKNVRTEVNLYHICDLADWTRQITSFIPARRARRGRQSHLIENDHLPSHVCLKLAWIYDHLPSHVCLKLAWIWTGTKGGYEGCLWLITNFTSMLLRLEKLHTWQVCSYA